jgi:hypothetical protein
MAGSEKKVKNVCPVCKALQMEKYCLARVAAAERAEGDIAVDDGSSDVPEMKMNLCCVSRALSQQQDFLNERPLIQHCIKAQGHICVFLPKFHCKFDPIEMYWGWSKHSELFSGFPRLLLI